jgi:RNA-binding protein
MITTKQRSVLRSLAQNIEPIGQIGKGGLSENQINSFSDALEKRELIKVSVLNNSDCDAKELIQELADALNAIPVCAIGHKIVLYRKSKRKDIEHIKF